MFAEAKLMLRIVQLHSSELEAKKEVEDIEFCSDRNPARILLLRTRAI